MNIPVDISKAYLETERLILRPFKESDLQDFYDYACVPGVGEMAGWPAHKDIEESKKILGLFLEENNNFAVVLKENNKVIGSLGIEKHRPMGEPYDSLPGREIGYVLAKDYWGRGLMPEAVKAAVSYCFHELNLHFLTCGHFNTNPQSQKVIEKSGFTYIKDIVFKTRLGTSLDGKYYIVLNNNF